MTRDQVKEVLDRVLAWPPERQQDAVEILKSIEEQDASGLQMTSEQLAELRQRRAKNDLNRIPFEDAFRRFRTPGK